MESSPGRFWLIVCLLALAAGVGYFLFNSKGAVEARKAVDGTAEQATGLGAVKVGEELQETIRGLSREHEEQARAAEK